jgi:hypothetical protein
VWRADGVCTSFGSVEVVQIVQMNIALGRQRDGEELRRGLIGFDDVERVESVSDGQLTCGGDSDLPIAVIESCLSDFFAHHLQ